MYKICKTDQSLARQRHIELELLSMLTEIPFDEISVSDLCNRMDIPRKAFYRYFSSKEGALFALIDHTLLEFYADGLRVGGGGAVGDLENFFLFWHSHRRLLDALDKSHLAGMLIERATLLSQKEKLMPRKILAMDSELQGIAMTFSISGLMAMVFQWYHQGFKITPQEITKIALDMLTRPLVQSPQPHKHGG